VPLAEALVPVRPSGLPSAARHQEQGRLAVSGGEMAALAVVGLLVAVALGGMVWAVWSGDGTEQFLNRADQQRLARQRQPELSEPPDRSRGGRW
jgi:hypothetical protein